MSPGPAPERERSWGAVVVDRADAGAERRYLLVKLASGRHWDSPKGHPEADESPAECARREIREETGIEVRFLGDFLKEVSWTLPDGRPKDVGYFLAEKTGTAPTGGPPGEILDVAWLPFDKALERVTYKSGREVLLAAREALNSFSAY